VVREADIPDSTQFRPRAELPNDPKAAWRILSQADVQPCDRQRPGLGRTRTCRVKIGKIQVVARRDQLAMIRAYGSNFTA